MNDCKLDRIPFIGNKFTWDNRRENEHNIKLALNRGYLNSEGVGLFPKVQFKHVVISVSDHSYLALSLEGWEITRKRGWKRFHFELAWLKNEECSNIIASIWNSNNCTYTNLLD